MLDGVKETLSNFSTVIRVVASGWVTVVLLLLFDPKDDTHLRAVILSTDRGIWLVAIGAGLVGVCAYALYMGFFENVLLFPVLAYIRIRFRSEADGVIDSWKLILRGDVTHRLYRERKARYASANERVKEIQSRMDTFYAWLVFLYCLLLLSVASTVAIRTLGLNLLHWNGRIVIAAIWFVAFCADVSITRDELWLVKNFPQWSGTDAAHKAVEPDGPAAATS